MNNRFDEVIKNLWYELILVEKYEIMSQIKTVTVHWPNSIRVYNNHKSHEMSAFNLNIIQINAVTTTFQEERVGGLKHSSRKTRYISASTCLASWWKFRGVVSWTLARGAPQKKKSQMARSDDLVR